MEHVPRVSALMPVYNGARYLEEALASIAAQTFTDFELVIVDDGSTDATPEILARWAARDPRIRLVRRPDNGGVARALNDGLAVARGEYLARQDADDVSMPGRFARQVAVLDSTPDAVVVAMEYVAIDDVGRMRGRVYLERDSEVLHHLLHFQPAMGVGAHMFRAEAVRAIGGWKDAFRVAQGWELCSRIMHVGRIVTVPEVGFQYRRHDGGVSIILRDQQMANAAAIARSRLESYLGREVSPDEAIAVGSVWFAWPRPDAAALSDRVMRETNRRFRETATDPRYPRRLRRVIASRFTRAAFYVASEGHLRGALQHLRVALRWHAPEVAKALLSIAVIRLRRTWKPDA